MAGHSPGGEANVPPPGMAARLFSEVAKHHIVVDIIIQNVGSDGRNDITFTIGKEDFAAASEVVLDVSVKEEACSLNLAPTASTTATMAMGDALAIALLDRRGFSPGDCAALHPGGRLGKKLLRAENLMHAGQAMPRVAAAAKMPDVIYEMSKKGLGMTTVVDAEGCLVGILTDGDLRRLMQQRGAETLNLVAGDCMTRNPQTIAPGELAGAHHQCAAAREHPFPVLDGAFHKHRGARVPVHRGRPDPQIFQPVLASINS